MFTIVTMLFNFITHISNKKQLIGCVISDFTFFYVLFPYTIENLPTIFICTIIHLTFVIFHIKILCEILANKKLKKFLTEKYF